MCSDFEQKRIYTEDKEIKKPVATVHYRGYDVNIYDDDYGQCYYFYFDDRCIGCGTYNFDYEGYVKYEIDRKLDYIETIFNDKSHHPSASIEYRFNQETGDRKKIICYDGFVKELETQEGDYHPEAKKFMDEIDSMYDEAHKDEPPRMFFSDLMEQFETEE